MNSDILKSVADKGLKDEVPYFEVGDSVEVDCRIKEGEKTRIQVFSGTVISRKGSGIHENFTVRHVVGNEGVERIFPLHSPNVITVRAIRSGKARRAKLYFLRDRVGKAVRLPHRHSTHTVSR